MFLSEFSEFRFPIKNIILNDLNGYLNGYFNSLTIYNNLHVDSIDLYSYTFQTFLKLFLHIAEFRIAMHGI